MPLNPLPSGVSVFAFRSRFPEFGTDVNDPDIQQSLVTALLWVDPAIWSSTDYNQALLFWAAHFLTLKQWQLATVQLGGSGETDIFIRQISFGERRVSFAERRSGQATEKMSGPGESMLEYTVYGQLYLMLRARNVPAVAIV